MVTPRKPTPRKPFSAANTVGSILSKVARKMPATSIKDPNNFPTDSEFVPGPGVADKKSSVPGSGFTALKSRASLATVKDLAPTGLPAAVKPTKKVGIEKNLTVNPLTLGMNSSVERVEPFRNPAPTLRTTLGDKLKGAASTAWKGLGKLGGAVKPEFLSNVANELIGPTGPRTPNLMTGARPVSKVNMDATRAAIQSSESAIGRGADQSVDGNTANAVRLGARAQSLGALNSVAENEAQANTRVDIANAQTQTQTDYVNTNVMNKYQDDLQELGNTRKSQKLGNLANFADKIVAGKNVEATQQLDREKMAILAASFDPGVTQRSRDLVTTALGKKKRGGKLTQYAL